MSQTGSESLIHLRFTLGVGHSEILLLLSTAEFCLQTCETSTQEKTVLFLVISQLEGNPSLQAHKPTLESFRSSDAAFSVRPTSFSSALKV